MENFPSIFPLQVNGAIRWGREEDSKGQEKDMNRLFQTNVNIYT